MEKHACYKFKFLLILTFLISACFFAFAACLSPDSDILTYCPPPPDLDTCDSLDANRHVEFTAVNGTIKCKRDAPWIEHFFRSDISMYFAVKAVPNKGFYFDRWEIIDNNGWPVTTQGARVNVLALSEFYVEFNNIGLIRAIFTDNESRLVPLDVPDTNIYGINGAGAIFNELPSRIVMGTYLVRYIVPDSNSVLYRVGKLYTNPDPYHWLGGHFVNWNMIWHNAHLGFIFMISDNGYVRGGNIYDQPFPFSSFEVTARLKKDVSVIRINPKNQNDYILLPSVSFETHIVPLGEIVVIAHICQLDVRDYSLKFDYRVVASTTFHTYFAPFLRWECSDRNLKTTDYYFIIQANYHQRTFYRVNYKL